MSFDAPMIVASLKTIDAMATMTAGTTAMNITAVCIDLTFVGVVPLYAMSKRTHINFLF